MVIPSTGYAEQMQFVSSLLREAGEIDHELERRGRDRTPHVTLNCAQEGCVAVITLDRAHEQRLRQTHETMICPAGHLQHFTG